MLQGLQRRSGSRLGAALVVLALGGAPALASHAEKEGEHRCQCRHGAAERCECPICARAARKAARAEAEQAPPCHRAQLLAALEKDEPSQPPGPCVKGRCGGAEERAVPVQGVDPFPLPLETVWADPPPRGAPDPWSGAPLAVPAVPETPPPRRA